MADIWLNRFVYLPFCLSGEGHCVFTIHKIHTSLFLATVGFPVQHCITSMDFSTSAILGGKINPPNTLIPPPLQSLWSNDQLKDSRQKTIDQECGMNNAFICKIADTLGQKSIHNSGWCFLTPWYKCALAARELLPAIGWNTIPLLDMLRSPCSNSWFRFPA